MQPRLYSMARVALISLVAIGTWVSQASAQDLGISILGIEGRTGAATTDPVMFPIGKTDCALNDGAGANMRLRITGIATDATYYLDFWQGDDCNLVENRRDDGGGVECRALADENGMLGDEDLMVSSQSQVDLSIPLAALVDCGLENATDGTFDIFVLLAERPQSRAEVSSYNRFQIRADFTPPRAPENARGSDGATSSGDTAIPIRWDATTQQNELLRYNLYAAGACNAGSDGGLDGGAGLPANDPVITAEPSANSIGLSGELLGLEYDQSTAVYVTSVDRASNESEPSNSVCVTRVPVAGFCDVHGECEDCSLQRLDAPPYALVAIGLAVATLARRRRR